MCDTDMDDFIEYELTRDCIEMDDHDDEFLYTTNEDYEIVEALEDEEDHEQILNSIDIKPEIIQLQLNEHEIVTMKTEPDILEDDENGVEHHLIEDDTTEENGYDEIQEIEYEEQPEIEEENNSKEHTEPIVPSKEKSHTKEDKSEEDEEKQKSTSGQRRYLLFDELVACIVDYDTDGTPIVEFSISNMESDEKLPVECGICPEIMSRTKIPKHLKTHLIPGTNRYQCVYCEETYKDCKYLAGHARRHMGIRPYVCELCKLYFSTKQDLRVHNQRRHQEKDHICEVCGKTFAQNTQLKRHREATHEKKRRFQCDHCPKSYYKNFSLQEHIRAVHMGKRRMIVCPFCGMQCRDAHKMARHRKQMHLHQTHFECHICNEEFTDINYFDAHKRSIQCRNNTRRKLEEEALLQEQQQQKEEEETLQLQYKTEIIEQQEEDSAENYIHQFEDDDDVDQPVQIIDEADIKHLIPLNQHQTTTGQQFILNNQLLQHHKIEILEGDDVTADEELVYEITIDSNE